MNAQTSSSAPDEKLFSSVEAEISRLVEQKAPNPPTQIEADPERIKAAIARLTSNSIDGLEGTHVRTPATSNILEVRG